MHPTQLARLAPTVCLIAALAAPEAGAATGVAQLTGVSYDPQRQALVVPFNGPLPTYELHVLSPTRAYFDIQPSHWAGLYTLHFKGGGNFSNVVLANRPEGTATRLAFSLLKPGTPSMGWDRSHHRLVIGMGTPAGATPKPVTLPSGTPPPAPTPKPDQPTPAVPTPRTKPIKPLKPGKPTPKPTLGPAALATPKPGAKPRPQGSAKVGQKTPTVLKSVYFDNARGILVAPFTGAVPTYSLNQPNAGELAIDFAGTSLAKANIRQDLDRHPLLRRWMVSQLPGAKPTTRLTLAMASSAEVGVAHDPSLGAMLIIPEPLADSAPPPQPAPRAKTRLATPVFDPRTSELTLTFAGSLPAYRILRPSSTTAYVDLPYAELIAGTMPFERVDLNPLLTFWLLAGRPTIEGQRLILHLPFGGDLQIKAEPSSRRLVVKVVAPEPSLTPASSSPVPMLTPRPGPTSMGLPPSAEPFPEPSLALPSPSPTPMRGPDAPLAPAMPHERLDG